MFPILIRMPIKRLVGLCLLIILFAACRTAPPRRELKQVSEIASISPNKKFIKAHMKDGRAYVLFGWRFDEATNTLSGNGVLLDVNRKELESRGDINKTTAKTVAPFSVPLDQVALLETNDPGPSLAGGMIVVTGITAVMAVLCITNPKACFGSCPTFFASDGETLSIQAEGFSTSIAPSLEKEDIDMLYTAIPSRDFVLTLTNEALETHSIRYANLLLVQRDSGERVFITPDQTFYRCANLQAPARCQSAYGSCLSQLSDVDAEEYFSTTDSIDLNSKEEVFLEFERTDGRPVGLVIGKRQTLLTTFLMYQGLAYMGASATYWLAEVERGNEKIKDGILRLLGGIEVYYQSGDQWILAGALDETGPIATDYNVIPLDVPAGNVSLKLKMTKGMWRINYVALAEMGEAVEPIVVPPDRVEQVNGSENHPLEKLVDDEEHLVTYPGDVYRIHYSLPSENVELFLASRGYYLEWMREDWIKEQNYRMLGMMLKRPDRYLKKMAPAFKQLEPTMEATFWNSRYEK